MSRQIIWSRVTIIIALLVSLVSYFTPVSADEMGSPDKASILADTAPASSPQIVPLPVSLATNGETFMLSSSARIVVTSGGDNAVAVANELAAILRPSTGYALPVSQDTAAAGDIALGLSGSSSLGDEGYQLDVNATSVQIEAFAPAGLFYGVQTLRQLLPPWIKSATPQPGPWTMPGVSITDYPRYQYRGMHLDIARHFEPPDAVKLFIDEISAFKINVLHLHVSDDQGFRIAINGRPELTDIGSQFSVGNDPGGYWTQAEYMDVVNYAAAHFMTVMPEVDSPGHNNAIIMSYNTGPNPPYPVYPDVNCSTNNPPVWNLSQSVGYSALCPESPHTWEIYTDIISQLSAMSSSPYYDIGGDEVSSINTARYNAFVDQESAIVRAQGKAPLGWADISSAGFTPSDSPVGVAQFWSNSSPTGSGGDTGRAAVAKGMQVIMTPANHTYLDMKYPGNSSSPLGLTWAGSLDISNIYNWSGSTSDPATYIPSRTVSTTLSVVAAAGATNIKVSSTSGFLPFIPLTIDTGANLETVTVTDVGTAAASTSLIAPAGVGDTNVKVASVSNLPVGGTLTVDTGASLETVTITNVGTAAGTNRTLFVDALPGDTNIKVNNEGGFVVGQSVGIDTGANLETATVTAVGTRGRSTTLSAASAAGATNIKVGSVTGFSVDATLTVDTGANLETRTITAVGTSGAGGTGVTLDAPLSLAHASGVSVRMLGTGIDFTPALTLAHALGASTRGLGTGVDFTPALSLAHDSGAALVSAGTGISFTPALNLAHSSGVAVGSTLPAVTDAQIVGVEGALWSETLVTIQDIEFQTFPRLPAIAEIGWSPKFDSVTAPDRTLASFETRLVSRGAAWQIAGTNFYASPQVPWRVDLSATDMIENSTHFDGLLATASVPGATLASLTATIDWGDGNSSTGLISGTQGTNKSINSLYTVGGTHDYAQDGVYHASVTVSNTGSTATANFTVTVDTMAPTVNVTVSPNSLWPANHKYNTIKATINVSDNLDPNPTVALVSVTSNEPDNGTGDGDTANDIVIVDNFTFQLRAERSGSGNGRIYTITYQVTDWAGNSTVETATVTVPHDKGK